MSPDKQIKVLGICGSLRASSYNHGLLNAVAELSPESIVLDHADISDFPLYSQDLEDANFPASVTRVKDQVAAADALLIASPEYNYGVSGVLKNCIDWLSRPPGRSSLGGKPVAIMGATPGMGATIRAQAQLRIILAGCAMHVMAQPELSIASAREKFDSSGRLIDESTRTFMQSKFLPAYLAWAIRMS